MALFNFKLKNTNLLLIIIIQTLSMFISGCDKNQEQAQKSQEMQFDPTEFQWPEFIKDLYEGNLESARKQPSDIVFLMLLYLKDMNEVFGDSGMMIFLGEQCFTNLYEPTMQSKLEAVVWGEQLPKIFIEIVSLMFKENNVNSKSSFEKRYPQLATILGDLQSQIPKGRLERLMYVKNMRSIFRDRARKDALILFTKYKCDSRVTQTIYKNAVRFVNMEPFKDTLIDNN